MNGFSRILLAILLVIITSVSACTQEYPEEQNYTEKPEHPLTLVLSLDEISKVPGVLNGKVSKPAAAVLVNGVEVEVSEDGSFSTLIEPAPSADAIEVVATLGEEKVTSSFTVASPPEELSVAISWPESGAALNVNVFKVKGTVSDPEAAVTVNGTEAHVFDDGSFYAYTELAEGKNNIEATAMLGEEQATQTISATFSRELCIHIKSETDVAFRFFQRVINARGTVSHPEAVVTVNGVKAKVKEDGSFSARVPVTTGNNCIEAVATFGEKEDSDSYLFIVTWYCLGLPVPGQGSEGHPRHYHDEDVDLKPGQTKELDITLETREAGPYQVNYKTTFVPEGLDVSIEPASFMEYQNTTYHLTLTIKAAPEAAPGECRCRVRGYIGNGYVEFLIKVNVEP